MRALKFLIPLLVFLGIGWFLLRGLDRDPREIPSPLVGKPVPQVSLPVLGNGAAGPWTPGAMKGQVWLLNVWGSWCAGCRVEHPLLNDIASRKLVPIVGMAWKDRPQDSKDWLARLGDPYVLTVMDRDGKAAIDWGVYGAPETFVIDKEGIVRDKFIGALTPEALSTRILPLVERLQAQ
ncbi:DsbE family thiol:disulfide interchange protein [Quisquiliibacterium transsilvanicum]|uniref:Cytochrome c biogenesis protein CcmG/thiol:disulfide interchange protein DsbE n=1 Tax=Quisquiliibacterium transsilvanicum TaxID=1549638 RepID=A0A7W8HHU7_9BURK|nr:DsbE family thiol:disulfide interchange protein [Quisquiliibacterium transsilvanicum]MBB5272311.1 cytochrome c biogenesis protein CcmG/thiol:disulfide interchange protein DsbE [Quisquiliibacterium transsilvanicum]